MRSKWIKLLRQAQNGVVAATSFTLAEYMTYWLAEVVQPNRAPLTYHTYETFNRVHIEPALGKKRLDRLTVRDVQQWINKLAESCQCCTQ
jgi:hypothetical protein